jgi:hypothetical protein
MNELQAVIKNIDDKISQLNDFLPSGRVGSFEEYKAICGEIKGLLFARNYALDLQKTSEESDE